MTPPSPGDDPSRTDIDTWDDAPCALLRLDDQGRVITANTRFLERTGYRSGDAVGRVFWDELLSVGSRIFFQTQLAPVLELDGVLEEVMVDLRAADGQRIPALMNARRIREAGRNIGTRVALMSVPDRRAYENELRRARDDAEHARAADVRARKRLELLADASGALAGSGNVTVAISRLAVVMVDRLADWCVIYAADPAAPDAAERSVAHADPAQQSFVERFAELFQAQATRYLSQAITTPSVLNEISETVRRDLPDGVDLDAAQVGLALSGGVIVPCTARGARLAAIVLGRGPTRPAFSADDLADLIDIGARAGVVIDNLHRQAREHSNSVALQQALLTVPPLTSRLQIATRYRPATVGNEVGGDWYDAFLQPDATPVLVIGDVVGHDIHAAAAMGQLRGLIRSISFTQVGTPAETLARTDTAARGLGVNVLASALVARVETDPARNTTLRWSNAGHPPPILITREGVHRLEARPDRLLGLGPGFERPRHDHHCDLEPGDTVLLYTDGLIERVDEDIETGMMRLVNSLRHAATTELDDLCDLVLKDHLDGGRDDIALLAIRVIDDLPT